MEEKKLSQHLSLFEFVVSGMLSSKSKNLETFRNLHQLYNKNKNTIIKVSNYRVIIDIIEYTIKSTNREKTSNSFEMRLESKIINKIIINHFKEYV